MSDQHRMILGREVTRDGDVGDPIGLQKDVWNRHLLISGRTGSGKSTMATTAIASAHPATSGPTVVLDPKGDGWLREVARAHYARTGSLDDVLYFDVSKFLPAISYFDIRRDVAAGVDRLRAVQDVADHFIRLLDHTKPADFDAIRSPDVIRYLIMALFDPVHGADSYELSTLAAAVYAYRQTQTTPDVHPEWSDRLLDSITHGNARDIDTIAQGAVTRIEKFYGDGYLRPLFDHSPSAPSEAFSFHDWLTEDVLILLDLSGPSTRARRVLANLILSLFWRAVRTRESATNPPQSLLFIDEAPQLRIDSHLESLLALGRSQNLGVIPMVQYPAQFDRSGDTAATEDTIAYDELLNNIHSVVTGAVPSDDQFTARLSGSHMSQAEVENRLRNLPSGHWLFDPAVPRNETPIRSHTIADPPLPPGHPDGSTPLAESEQTEFDTAFSNCREHTSTQHGIPYDDYTAPDGVASEANPAPNLAAETWTQLRDTNFNTLLPLVDLPEAVEYDHDRTALRCRSCGSTHDCSDTGLRDAIRCHSDLDALDRSSVVPVELGLSMTPDELTAAPVPPVQILALQLLYNVKAGRYDPRVLDPVFDPLPRVFDTLSIDRAHLSELAEAGYLNNDDQFREFVYYDVTKDGRDLLNEPHRRGIDWGHKKRDQTESLLHIVMVDALARYLEQTAIPDPDSPVEDVNKYFELNTEQLAEYGLESQARLDVVGLDTTGQIHVVGEAERLNNDRAVAPIHDFDQLAAIDPEEAIWAVSSSGNGHEAVLQPLQDPAADIAGIEDDTPRLPTSFTSRTRISDISEIDSAGLTAIKTLNSLRKELSKPSLSD
ncbi:type IV secretory system conjugative DNA transfer family protein [Halorientalis litorea]|uniref:type IV secretory system conjugative DNA transfer family protein n=1 Tax=Halorientalis litorea TaxID=2931977 RepID=UPI001FF643DB|nr:DUF87 domain-containing protein [Halorientalis litorea]